MMIVSLKCKSSRILLINSYFPVDTRLNNYDEAELIETVQCIQSIINNTQHDAIIWAGDINTDFDRNTKHVNIVRNYIEENHLITAWDRFDIDFTHYNEVNGRSFVSKIDHFFWDNVFGQLVENSGVIHNPSNLSDHSPVYCQFNVNLVSKNVPSTRVSLPSKPSWGHSSESEKENFKIMLDQ